MATQEDYDSIKEGKGRRLCWIDFGSQCMDAEQALDVSLDRIAVLETTLEMYEAILWQDIVGMIHKAAERVAAGKVVEP
jgi:hypothetical protein